MNMLQKIKEQIETNHRFILLSHIHTDGDALGSLLAMYHFLKQAGKQVDVFVPGDLPEKYGYLETESIINQGTESAQFQKIAEAQVVFILDISALNRLDQYYNAVKKSGAYTIIIDHHPVEREWAELAWIDPQKIATAEMVYDFFKFINTPITFKMAQALYTAILSDSGSFRFFKTGAGTFRMAAELVEAGVEPSKMFSRIFETARLQQLQAWGTLLAGMNFENDCVWISVSKDFMDSSRLQLHEVDGLIDIMRRENRAKVFAVFVEKEADEILVGLRSKNNFDVGALARSLGGGGHFHASGFTGRSSLKKIVSQTLKLISSANQKD